MRTLLIADMHLSHDTPEINQGFYRYLEQTAQGADALYILGEGVLGAEEVHLHGVVYYQVYGNYRVDALRIAPQAFHC